MKAQSRSLLIFPLVQVGAAIVLIVAGILGWGAAGAGYEDWIPTFSGVFIGGFILVGALLTLKRVRAKLDIPTRIRAPQVYAGITASLLLTAFALFAVAFVGDADAYRARQTYDESGLLVTDSSLEPRGLVIATIVVCIPGPISWLVWAAYRYLGDAIDPISSEVQGLDPMGELMRKA